MDYSEEMKNIFIKCQANLQCHEKLRKELHAIYNKVTCEDFTEQFISLVQHPLTILETSPAVERLFTFISKFVTSFEKKAGEENETNGDDDDDDEPMNPFVLEVFNFLLKVNKSKSVAVRCRVCYLLNKLLGDLGSDASINGDLFADIQNMLLERLLDTNNGVRTQAAYALSWLQEPTNLECPVIDAYLFHMSHDPSASVRRVVLTMIATTPKTLGSVLGRIRDVNENVRKIAYVYLADKVCVRMLSISQRVKLLTQGLNDRSERIRKAVTTKLLPVWIKYFDNNIEKFLHSLDIQGSSDIAEQTLQVLFKSQGPPSKLIKNFDLLDENHLIPIEKLTCEGAFLWRCLCQYIKSLDGAIAVDGFDDLISDLTPFCEYLKSYALMISDDWSIEKRLEHEFVCLQLLTLASEFDLTDQAGRKNLLALMKELLLTPKVNLILVKPLIACYKKLQTHHVQFMDDLIEIISEIREPITLVEKSLCSEVIHGFKMQIANISVELNILRDQQENCIASQDFVEAQRLKLKITELEERKAQLEKSMSPESQEVRIEHNDAHTLLKCLTIATEMLRTSIKGITSPLQSLMETLLLPGIQNEEPAVRNEAVLALGLCCLRSANVASQHLLLFLQIAQVDQETVRVTALRAVFDILLYYGLEAFQCDTDTDANSQTNVPGEHEITSAECSQQDKALSGVLSILVTLLDSDLSEVRTVVAENLGKMLHLGRIFSPQLFSRLVLLWYSPITENDTYLRHFLGVFFPEFAGCGRQRNNECLEESFMLTLRTLFNAPPSSPLSRIDDWNIASFLIQITHTSVAKQDESVQESTLHDHIAVQVCYEIIKDPNSFNVRVLSKILCHLELSKHNGLKDVFSLGEEIFQEVKDKQSIKFLEKFLSTVRSLLAAMSEPVSSSQETVPPSEPMSVDAPCNVISRTANVSAVETEPIEEQSTMQDVSHGVLRSLEDTAAQGDEVNPCGSENSIDVSLETIQESSSDIEAKRSSDDTVSTTTVPETSSISSSPSASSKSSVEIISAPLAILSLQMPSPVLTRSQRKHRAEQDDSSSESSESSRPVSKTSTGYVLRKRARTNAVDPNTSV